ncbi:hypothetical protein [Halobacillus litoralis]|uniref:Uncharacterized protein n=1 Tax=Halobacillus litoralis TaxID=45668 RepID=A0A410MJ90_9BACI|nr:hypothetical protein [Halobacillus litoralis]QAS54760.1 hypothetical protein HLI_21115 [Halobacillus litoralis]
MKSFKGRIATAGDRVDVYKNLHTGGFSVRSKSSGKVLCHVDSVTLTDCKFHVSKSGREKTVKEKRRRVHAWVQGTLDQIEPICEPNIEGIVYYNPYKTETFVEGEETVTYAENVLLKGDHAYRCSKKTNKESEVECTYE